MNKLNVIISLRMQLVKEEFIDVCKCIISIQLLLKYNDKEKVIRPEITKQVSKFVCDDCGHIFQ